MIIDDSIVRQYLAGVPCEQYSSHWVFHELAPGEHLFCPPQPELSSEIESCRSLIAAICGSFTFRNAAVVGRIFGEADRALEHANVLLTVGLPQMYDALVTLHDGAGFVVIDLVNLHSYTNNGHNLEDLVGNFLSHELIHVLINERYPQQQLSYTQYLDFISFHEGFAHLLSYREDIDKYQPGSEYEERFLRAKARLLEALGETDPELQKQYMQDANAGRYWDKFASISAMLYLMRHIAELREIYDSGWHGFAEKIVAFNWE